MKIKTALAGLGMLMLAASAASAQIVVYQRPPDKPAEAQVPDASTAVPMENNVTMPAVEPPASGGELSVDDTKPDATPSAPPGASQGGAGDPQIAPKSIKGLRPQITPDR